MFNFHKSMNTGKYSHYSDSKLYAKIERILSSGRFSHPTQHKRCIEDISDMLFVISYRYFDKNKLPYNSDPENECNKAVQKTCKYIEAGEYNSNNITTYFKQILKTGYIDALRSSKSGHNRFSAISLNTACTDGRYEGLELSDIIADDRENIFDRVSEKADLEFHLQLIAEYAKDIHEDFEFVCDILNPDLKPKEIAEKYSNENEIFTNKDIYSLKTKIQKNFEKWQKTMDIMINL